MKIKSMFFFLLIIAFARTLNAQDIFYPEIEPYLNVNQKLQLEKSVNILLKARGNENNANDIERKYAKFKKRQNQEAWREKTWEAKEQRILAEKNYKLAYKIIADVYSEIITKAEYENDATKKQALSLNNKALDNFEEANSLVTQYNDAAKETLAQSVNEQIDSTLQESHSLKLNAISYQIEALQIFINKGKQTSPNNKEELAWENAKKENTISSYYEYLNNNPRGKHMADANQSISVLEKKSSNDAAENTINKNNKNIKNNNETNNSTNSNNKYNPKTTNGNLIFKVQIAASKKELSSWMLNAKAPGIKDIETLEKEGWIKYIVGQFNSYSEAAKYRDELRSHAPDAFIVVFNNGNQIEVTTDMKN